MPRTPPPPAPPTWNIVSLNALEIDEGERDGEVEWIPALLFLSLVFEGNGREERSRRPSQALAPSTEHARDGMGLQLLRLILLLTAFALCAHCSGGEGVPSEAGWMVDMPCDEAPVGGHTSDRSQQRIK